MKPPQKSPRSTHLRDFNSRYVIDFRGERGRNRTYNLVIKSHLLCQLSYAPAVVEWKLDASPRRAKK